MGYTSEKAVSLQLGCILGFLQRVDKTQSCFGQWFHQYSLCAVLHRWNNLVKLNQMASLSQQGERLPEGTEYWPQFRAEENRKTFKTAQWLWSALCCALCCGADTCKVHEGQVGSTTFTNPWICCWWEAPGTMKTIQLLSDVLTARFRFLI